MKNIICMALKWRRKYWVSDELGYKFMDTDDYFWLPTNPRYTTKRSKEERLSLKKKDISENDNVVISGSLEM